MAFFILRSTKSVLAFVIIQVQIVVLLQDSCISLEMNQKSTKRYVIIAYTLRSDGHTCQGSSNLQHCGIAGVLPRAGCRD